MRIISGKFCGKRLKSLAGDITRPTTDKVKESLFNIIGPYFDGGACLDLFAGSGALGIEAVSRGMSYAVLVERNFKAMQVIKSNVELIGAKDCFKLIKKNATAALSALVSLNLRFDLIFLDPPYKQQEIESQLEKLQNLHLLTKNVLIVAKTASKVRLPQRVRKLTQYRKQVYGITAIYFFGFEEINNE
ncbi:MAG: 16S rRNA (guanine(966)-N(2))-methyltransferase RsmD [Streptococcaceae bacterium]|jgi:16S rRNA (guanine966-N2)-methyltransferase|nr:16S rRNA (guanine(966)-N(2))-methyltransferase RsmD [Streptococcaceae bacterium]